MGYWLGPPSLCRLAGSALTTPLIPPLLNPKQDLKEEYRLYRKQALVALKEKDAAIAGLKASGGGGGGA